MTQRQRITADLYAYTREKFPHMLRRSGWSRKRIHAEARRSALKLRSWRRSQGTYFSWFKQHCKHFPTWLRNLDVSLLHVKDKELSC